MPRVFKNYLPPVGFFFNVVIMNEGGNPGPPSDNGFQEVSGISMKMDTTQINEGGENRFAHTVPTRASYDDLVLKRGLMVHSSPLATWVRAQLSGGLNKKIKPHTIKVSLLDANKDSDAQILMSWVFENAYPIKWDVSSLDAQKNEILVESLTFTYSLFHTEDQVKAANYPLDRNG